MNEPPEPGHLDGAVHPRAQPHLFGHAAAAATLARAAQSKRLPHAWLVTGPSGVGKATLAYRFARYLLAYGDGSGPADLSVAPDDGAFRRVAAGTHADLLVLRRTWDNERKRYFQVVRADDVRKLAGFTGRHASEGGFRVCIADTADDMADAACNALLKTLEEPPARTVFLILAAQPGRLPTTIRSRCRLLALRPLSHDEMAAGLAVLAPDLDPPTRRSLSAAAGGSLGWALSLLNGGGLEIHAQLVHLLRSLPALDVTGVHALADRVAKAGDDAAWRAAITLLGALIARVATGRGAGADLVSGEADVLGRLRAQGNVERWCALWDKLRDAAVRVDELNFDKRQALLVVFDAAARAARP